MTPKIALNLTKNYKATLKDLKKRLVAEIGDKLDSIVLYGSVARGDFGPESDIDLVLIVEDKGLSDRASDIRYDIDVENGTVTTFLIYSPKEMDRLIQQNYPFIQNVLGEGKVIYDNGTWQRLRRGPARAGR